MAFYSVVTASYRRLRFFSFFKKSDSGPDRAFVFNDIGLIAFLINPFVGRIPSDLKNNV